MKTIFHVLAAVCAASAMMFTSCSKTENPDNGDNGDNGGNGGVDTDLPVTLTEGSNFYVIQLGEEEYEYLEAKKKVAMNLMPYKIEGTETDGIALYVWENTYVAGETSGTNSFDFTSGWVSLVVNNVGWSGAGYSLTTDGVADRTDLAEFSRIDEDYYFRFAYKSDQDATSHVGILAWAGDEYKFVFGDPEGTFNDDGKVTNRILPVGGEYKKGEWNVYEIPVKDMPLDFTKKATDTNLFAFLSGLTAGTTIDLDGIFYYKKN